LSSLLLFSLLDLEMQDHFRTWRWPFLLNLQRFVVDIWLPSTGKMI
jgi:hypothetical protein